MRSLYYAWLLIRVLCGVPHHQTREYYAYPPLPRHSVVRRRAGAFFYHQGARGLLFNILHIISRSIPYKTVARAGKVPVPHRASTAPQ